MAKIVKLCYYLKRGDYYEKNKEMPSNLQP